MWSLIVGSLMAAIMVFLAGVAFANTYFPNGRPFHWEYLPRNTLYAVWAVHNKYLWVFESGVSEPLPIAVIVPLKKVKELRLKIGSYIRVVEDDQGRPVLELGLGIVRIDILA